MNKENLTLAEVAELKTELISQGITIATPIPELPVGLYSGKFQTQTQGTGQNKVINPVISCIEYTKGDKAMAFFAVKADMSNEEKSYNNVNIGLTDELEEQLADASSLTKPYTFRSKQGTKRTFVTVEG